MLACVLALGLLAQGDPAFTPDDARAFAHELTAYVRAHHLKADPDSPQRGMVYEYFDTTRAGREGAWIQGEALDTMHDGAWLAAALVQLIRATGDPDARALLVRDILPFYVKMLNHSDELFDPACNAATKDMPEAWDREHLLTVRERGFVPYFWDDGASVSLEAGRRKDGRPPYPACDRLAGKRDLTFRLDGYSLGSSNHLAQDLGVMLQQAWLLLRSSADPAEQALAVEVQSAARHLAASRLKRAGPIPAVMAALAPFDAEAARTLPELKEWNPDNHATRCLVTFKPGQSIATPGFADDQEYGYYAAVARAGGTLPRPAAQRLVYDAYTLPLLYRFWSDDAPVSPGMNRFDLHPYAYRDGKPDGYRSDRVRPAGSRIGPQLLKVTAWAIQALKADPGLYEARYREYFADDLLVPVDPEGSRIFFNYSRKPHTPTPSEILRIAGTTLRFLGGPTGLAVYSSGLVKDDVTFRIYSGPDATGTYAEVRLKELTVTAHNANGQPILVPDIGRMQDGVARLLDFSIPYTAAKGQATWVNGLDHHRFSVQLAGVVQNCYLMTPESALVPALERELAGGLRTWERIFRERGYIPTGIGAGSVADRRWDDLSDSGGYAHLIAACAQFINLKNGARDWGQWDYPQHPAPSPAAGATPAGSAP